MPSVFGCVCGPFVSLSNPPPPAAAARRAVSLPPHTSSVFFFLLSRPAAAAFLSPGMMKSLWWRFLQNLRQCYDAKQRWPYLGNAFKYFLAAEVATFGMFDPSVKKSPLWLTCFFVTTLYQVWWDVFMDWGLLEIDPNFGYYNYYGHHHDGSTGVSGGGRWCRGLFWWWPYTLRSRRLYDRSYIYHVIFGLNFCLRFVGMMTLMPTVYLSRTTGLIVDAYKDSPDFRLFSGSLVASAEIFRRTIWALLRLEWEVIKTTPPERGAREGEIRNPSTESNVGGSGGGRGNILRDEEEMKPMTIASSGIAGGDNRRAAPFFSSSGRKFSAASLSDMSNLNDIQILSELCVWATVFSGVAIIAAAHREVL